MLVSSNSPLTLGFTEDINGGFPGEGPVKGPMLQIYCVAIHLSKSYYKLR